MKVSVLVAAFDGERFLREALESLLEQTFADFELIVVDDASTDGTAAILASYGDARLRVLRHDENRGIGAALHTALAAAQGEYVAVQDQDDVSLPERLAVEVALLDERPELVVVGSDAEVIDADGRVLGYRRLPRTDTWIRWGALFVVPFVHSSVLFRGDVVRRQGLQYDPSITRGGADDDFLASLLPHGKALNLDRPLVRRRVHESQVRSTVADDVRGLTSLEVARRNIQALGVGLSPDENLILRRLHYEPPERFGEEELRGLRILFRMLDAFRRRPEVDAGDARAIARHWIDTALARTPPRLLPHVLGDLLRADAAWVGSAPVRWLRSRGRGRA